MSNIYIYINNFEWKYRTFGDSLPQPWFTNNVFRLTYSQTLSFTIIGHLTSPHPARVLSFDLVYFIYFQFDFEQLVLKYPVGRFYKTQLAAVENHNKQLAYIKAGSAEYWEVRLCFNLIWCLKIWSAFTQSYTLPQYVYWEYSHSKKIKSDMKISKSSVCIVHHHLR